MLEGTARVAGTGIVDVDLDDGTQTRLQTADIIIATGARPRSIPGVSVDGARIITYTEAILAPKLPESVVIIGAGPIGVEFAYIWRNYGVEVTLVEMMDRILPLEDAESSAVVERAYRKLGIRLLTGALVQEVRAMEGGVEVDLRRKDDVERLTAEKSLIAIGFQPNVEGLGLEAAGVRLTERGSFIEVDDRMETNVAHIYAAGDVTGKLMLAHVGSAMGMVAAEAIAGLDPAPLDYEMMPRCVYSQPQVASFGYTEEQAQAAGFVARVGKFPFLANGKALGLGERDGFVKIVSDATTGELLGGHLVGPEVTELLPELTLARGNELTAAELASNVHAHPTLSEAIMEASHDAVGYAIHI